MLLIKSYENEFKNTFFFFIYKTITLLQGIIQIIKRTPLKTFTTEGIFIQFIHTFSTYLLSQSSCAV